MLAGTAEVCGGFSLAAGLLTPLGTALVIAVMTTAILTAQIRNGIWVADGGFEYTLTLATTAFVVTALGPGGYSINAWLDVDNWAGLDSTISDPARAALAGAVGVIGGLLPAVGAIRAKRALRGQSVSRAQARGRGV
jgi:hypothetical protein